MLTNNERRCWINFVVSSYVGKLNFLFLNFKFSLTLAWWQCQNVGRRIIYFLKSLGSVIKETWLWSHLEVVFQGTCSLFQLSASKHHIWSGGLMSPYSKHLPYLSGAHCLSAMLPAVDPLRILSSVESFPMSRVLSVLSPFSYPQHCPLSHTYG